MVKPFKGVFGNTGELRIIEYLIVSRDWHSIHKISSVVDISLYRANGILKKFKGLGMVEEKEIERIRRYRINSENEIIRKMGKIYEYLYNGE